MKKVIFRYVCIILSFVAGIMVVFPWLKLNHTDYSIIHFYTEALVRGRLNELAGTDGTAYLLTVFLAFPVMGGICSVIKGILLICKKPIRIITGFVLTGTLVYVTSFFAFVGYIPKPAAIIYAAAILIEFLIERYLADVDRYTSEWEEQKKRERLEKAERKRRLYFPGKYDRMLWKIIKNEILHQKKAIIFMLCGNVILLGSAFSLYALKTQFQHYYSAEALLPMQGLNGILTGALMVIGALYIFLEAIAFYNYSNSHQTRNVLLWTLGIREELSRKIWWYEHGLIILISIIPGFLLGTGMYTGMESYMKRLMNLSIDKFAGVKIYFISAVLYIILSFVIIRVFADMLQENMSLKQQCPKRKSFLTKRNLLFLMFFSFIYLAYFLFRYSERRNGEDISYILFGVVIGGIILLCSVRILVNLFRQNRRDTIKKVLDKIPIQRGAAKELGLQAAIFLFHFVFLCVLVVPLAGNLSAPDPEALFPYDYVCMAYPEDANRFEEIKNQGIAEVHSYPMVRVTSVQGEKTDWIDAANNYYQKVIWPQGQHIGISYRTYKSLCQNLGVAPQKLNLNDKEVYIVYQEDYSINAHPIDWYMNRKTPYLRIGQPVRFYNYMSREKVYPPRMIAGEERTILTGVFQSGEQENLVVFSDGYFQSLTGTEGPTRLYLLKENAKYHKRLQTELQKFVEKHMEDFSWDQLILPCYSKNDKMWDVKMERILKESALILEIILTLLCTVILYFMKNEFEKDERRIRFDMLFCLGMHQKQAKIISNRELYYFAGVPLLLSLLLSIITIGITFHVRMVSISEALYFGTYIFGLWIIYIFIQILLVLNISKKRIKELLSHTWRDKA